MHVNFTFNEYLSFVDLRYSIVNFWLSDVGKIQHDKIKNCSAMLDTLVSAEIYDHPCHLGRPKRQTTSSPKIFFQNLNYNFEFLSLV